MLNLECWQDGGGDIDFEEFESFWNAYNFEVAV